MPGTARQLESQQVQELISSYQAGATVYQFGSDRRTMSQIMHHHGAPMPARPVSEQIDEAVRLYEACWPLARIGERMGADPTTMLTKLRERGTRMQDTHGRSWL